METDNLLYQKRTCFNGAESDTVTKQETHHYSIRILTTHFFTNIPIYTLPSQSLSPLVLRFPAYPGLPRHLRVPHAAANLSVFWRESRDKGLVPGNSCVVISGACVPQTTQCPPGNAHQHLPCLVVFQVDRSVVQTRKMLHSPPLRAKRPRGQKPL